MASEEAPTRWWEGDPAEMFWLEITDRDDLGVDLNAPAEREEGGDYWSYAFVREVREGDVVLHYRARPNNAITHWSRAVGDPYRDQVYWGAHGQASGRGPVDPYWRPGWRHPLEGPYELPEPVTAARLRELEPQIRQIHDALRAAHPGASIYFPLQLSDTRPLRAFQGYLTSSRGRSWTSYPSSRRFGTSPNTPGRPRRTQHRPRIKRAWVLNTGVRIRTPGPRGDNPSP